MFFFSFFLRWWRSRSGFKELWIRAATCPRPCCCPMPPCPGAQLLERPGLCTSSGTWSLKWTKVRVTTHCYHCPAAFVLILMFFYFAVNICIWRDTVFCFLENFPWLYCSAGSSLSERVGCAQGRCAVLADHRTHQCEKQRDHYGRVFLHTFLPLEMSFSVHYPCKPHRSSPHQFYLGWIYRKISGVKRCLRREAIKLSMRLWFL